MDLGLNLSLYLIYHFLDKKQPFHFYFIYSGTTGVTRPE
jgi:hypothetical protein